MIAVGKDNGAEMFPIVDEQGNIIGKATRAECHGGSMLLHPVVHLHVFNTSGELYLQKRPEWKDIQPGRWDTAVGGHVDLGETVEQALRREALEEIGIVLPDEVSTESSSSVAGSPIALTPYVFQSSRERELVNPFYVVTDAPIHPSAETDGGRFWSRQEILDNLGKGVFTPNFEQEVRVVYNSKFIGGSSQLKSC